MLPEHFTLQPAGNDNAPERMHFAFQLPGHIRSIAYPAMECGGPYQFPAGKSSGNRRSGVCISTGDGWFSSGYTD